MRPKLNNFFHNPGGRWLASVLLVLGLVGSAAAIVDILGFPGGFTASRAVLLAIPVLTGLSGLSILVVTNRHWTASLRWITGWVTDARRTRIIDAALPVLWCLLLVIAFLPPNGLGRYTAAYDRVNGLLQLAFFYITKLWIFWLFQKSRFNTLTSAENRKAFIAGSVLAAFIIFIVAFIAVTGMGIGAGTQFWGKSGIPVLHWQIGLALCGMVAVILMDRIIPPLDPAWLKDLVIITLLWLAAMLIWQSATTPVSRFVTASYPPNYTSYPYSDAGDYALEAEAILAGNGFPYGFLDKPLHLTMLAGFSWLAGADYARMMLLQIGIMAFIPGLIYLLGKRLYNKPAGLLAGTIVLFMQANNLRISDRVQATNAEMAMSEPLTALLLILFCLSVATWWTAPRRTWLHAAVSGALLGLTALVRLNTLVILPFILLAWLLAFNIRRRQTWLAALVFVLFCVLGQVPWTARNQVVNGNAMDSYISKVIGVVLKRRINPIVDTGITAKTPDSGIAAPGSTPQAGEGEPGAATSAGQNLINSFTRTGLHNLATVSLSLPASVYHEGLEETIRQPYWDQEWNGTFAEGGQWMLAFSLLVVVLGFSLGWKRGGAAGLIPTLILIPYLLSNSLSMVSGGRYIIPVDWVLPTYYALGLAGITIWLFRLEPEIDIQPNDAPSVNRWLWVQLAAILAFACLPTALSLLIPKQFTPMETAAVLSEIKKISPEWPEGVSVSNLEKLAASPDASFKVGRAMFPRLMKTGEGDTAGRGSAFSVLPFDHLSFAVISDDKYPFDAVLPVDQTVDPLPNASRVILAGCKTEAYFDTAVMIVLDPTPKAYIRKDAGSFTCPLPQP
jgi:hypothetical protein